MRVPRELSGVVASVSGVLSYLHETLCAMFRRRPELVAEWDSVSDLREFWTVYARAALPGVIAETAAAGMEHNRGVDEDEDKHRRNDHAAVMAALIVLRALPTVAKHNRRAYLDTVLDSLRPAARAYLEERVTHDDDVASMLRRQLPDGWR